MPTGGVEYEDNMVNNNIINKNPSVVFVVGVSFSNNN